MADNGATPAIPTPGPVLPSGDAVPIEALALALIQGEIPAIYDGLISKLTDQQFEELWDAFARMRATTKR
jgi:hypothetical protein